MIDHAVIIATGSPGHRSRLVHNRAQAMLPAAGKPLIVQAMNRFYRLGIRQFTVIIGEKEGAVAAYLNDHWVPDAKLNMMLKSTTDSLPGLLQSITTTTPKPMIVSSYNSFTHNRFPERLMRQHTEHPTAMMVAGAASTLSKTPGKLFANLKDRQVTSFAKERSPRPPGIDKTLALTDIYIYGEKAVEYLCNLPKETLRSGFYWHLTDIAQHYFKEAHGEIYAAESSWLLQVESDDDLLILNRHLLNEGTDAHILSELPYTVNVIPPVRIDPQVNIGQGSTIGPHVYIERGCSVGHNSKISNAMILNHTSVPANTEISEEIVSSKGRGIT